MPLNVTVLESRLGQYVLNDDREVGAYSPDLVQDAALAFAEAYAGYAKDAQSCGGQINGSVLAAQQAALANMLAAGLRTARDPAAGANAYANALAVFWINPLLWVPVPPALPATLVVPTGGTPVLLAQLASFTAPTLEASAAGLSLIYDAWTRAVVVTHPLPGPPFVCALPIF